MKSENLVLAENMDEAQAKSVFQDFYTRYYRMLVGYAMTFVKSEGDAEDIVQDVFITLWGKREELLKDNNRMLRLLYVSIHNKCLDFLKHGVVELCCVALMLGKLILRVFPVQHIRHIAVAADLGQNGSRSNGS